MEQYHAKHSLANSGRTWEGINFYRWRTIMQAAEFVPGQKIGWFLSMLPENPNGIMWYTYTKDEFILADSYRYIDQNTPVVSEILEIPDKATTIVGKVDSEVRKSMTSVTSTMSANVKVIKEIVDELKDESELSEYISAKNKAARILELIQVMLDALNVHSLVKQYGKPETQSYVGRIVGEIEEIIKITKDITLVQIQEKVRLAIGKYEREILPYKLEVEENIEKAKEKEKKAKEREEKRKREVEAVNSDKDSAYDPKINSEDNLRDYLINRDPDLIAFLAEKNGGEAFTDEDIDEVIERIDKRHKQGANAINGSKKLKNEAIYKILMYGQAYITKVVAKGPVMVDRSAS
jgi:hypothetical protein